MTKANDFLYSLPESLTGKKDSKEYPLENIQKYLITFKKNADGTIDIKHISSAIDWVLRGLYRHRYLTIKPMLVTSEKETVENIVDETSEWVTITTFLDKSDR